MSEFSCIICCCLSLLLRKPPDLHNLAPGTHPPFLTFNGEVRTDVNKIEEYLEEMLAPPKYVVRAGLGFFLVVSACTSSTPPYCLLSLKVPKTSDKKQGIKYSRK